jgi:hypothetical protein
VAAVAIVPEAVTRIASTTSATATQGPCLAADLK